MLTRQKKEEIVSGLTEGLKSSSVIVIVNYKGMNVLKISNFRKLIRPMGGTLVVAKNTLVKISLKNSGFEDEELFSLLDSTNALLYVKDDGDAVGVLKALVKFEKDVKLPEIKGGFFEGVYYDADGIRELSKIPSREELLSMLLNRMQAPISKFVYGLNGIILKLAYALNAIKDEKSKNE